MKKRMKATDVFEMGKLVFAHKGTFEEAFPGIHEFSVRVKQSGAGQWPSFGDEQGLVLSSKDCGEYIDCSNPACNGGGAQIGSLLREMAGKHQEHLEIRKKCIGYEGSVKNRNMRRSCMNFFQITIDIQYKNNPTESEDSEDDP